MSSQFIIISNFGLRISNESPQRFVFRSPQFRQMARLSRRFAGGTAVPRLSPGSEVTGCCWPRFKSLPSGWCPALLLSVRHFDPNWHRGSGDAGAGQPFALQRSFELSSQLKSAARNSRFHGADTYLQRLRNFVRDIALDVAQADRFATGAAQRKQSAEELSFALQCQGLL